nr:hypothetical protein [Tanacetum cinerariifolium]
PVLVHSFSSGSSLRYCLVEGTYHLNILLDCPRLTDRDLSFKHIVRLKYLVDTDDFMSPLPEGWSIRSIVWSIVLGEKKDDSFFVINLSGKVVEYNLISKTPSEIYDMGSNQVADDYLHGFIPPFAMYDMGSKKVDHKVYKFIPSSASV